MKNRSAFTMIELVFVIVIMGFIGKFGVEFLMQAYKNFIFAKVNNELQDNSASAIEFISKRLENRIRDSVIARSGKVTTYDAIADINTSTSYTVLEWIAADSDGFRGTTKPNWSGIIDLENANTNTSRLISPETNTTAIEDLTNILSHGDSGVDDGALYFIGSNSNIDGYGWDGNAITIQANGVMHPIKRNAASITELIPRVGATTTTNNFNGVDVYEYYKYSWTANAIVIENYNTTTHMGDLVYYYDYQPWDGEKFYDNGKNIKKFTIMENISTFRFMAIGSIIKIQVCAKTDLLEEYSLCKEKTIF